MLIDILAPHVALVTVRRRSYGCIRRGATWHSDAGPVSPRVQRAIERAQQGDQR